MTHQQVLVVHALRDIILLLPVSQLVVSVHPELIQIKEADNMEVPVVRTAQAGIMQRPVQVLVRKTRRRTVRRNQTIRILVRHVMSDTDIRTEHVINAMPDIRVQAEQMVAIRAVRDIITRQPEQQVAVIVVPDIIQQVVAVVLQLQDVRLVLTANIVQAEQPRVRRTRRQTVQRSQRQATRVRHVRRDTDIRAEHVRHVQAEHTVPAGRRHVRQ